MFSESRMKELCKLFKENANPNEKVFLVGGCLVVYRDQAPPGWALAQRYATPIDPLSDLHSEALALDAKRTVEKELEAEGFSMPTATAIESARLQE